MKREIGRKGRGSYSFSSSSRTFDTQLLFVLSTLMEVRHLSIPPAGNQIPPRNRLIDADCGWVREMDIMIELSRHGQGCRSE